MIVAVLTLLGAIGVGKKVSDAINSDDPDDIDKSPGGTSDKSPGGTSDKSPDGPSDPKGEIADLKDKIAAAEKMGASQNVIDGLIRELNAKEKSLYIAQGPGKGESQELSEARYAASNLLKNIEYYDDIIANANPQNIEFINRMKKQQDFYKSDYADIVKKISELAPSILISESEQNSFPLKLRINKRIARSKATPNKPCYNLLLMMWVSWRKIPQNKNT